MANCTEFDQRGWVINMVMHIYSGSKATALKNSRDSIFLKLHSIKLFRKEFERRHTAVHDSKLRLFIAKRWSFCIYTEQWLSDCDCCCWWSHMDSLKTALPKNSLCPIHTSSSVDNLTWTLQNCWSRYKDYIGDTEHCLNTVWINNIQ